MNKLEKLNQFYTDAIKADDPESFYESAAAYMRVVNKDTKLTDWLEEEMKEYDSKKQEILRSDKSGDERAERVIALQKRSPGAMYANLETIVTKLHDEHQKAKADPDSDIDEQTATDESVWLKLRKLDEKYKKELRRFHHALLEEYFDSDDAIMRFYPDTGKVEYFDTAGKFSPSSREYRLFKKLYENVGDVVLYEDLVDVVYPKKNVNISNKQAISDVLNTVKHEMGILPKGKSSHKDIFENVRNTGYKLDIDI